MSTLLLFVVTIAVLCFTAEFAISVVQVWNRRTEHGIWLRLLFHSVLSAVLIILATLLLLYAENQAAVPILLVSLCAVGGISQGIHLSVLCELFRPGSKLWIVGLTSICFIIQLTLGFLTTRIIDYVLLSVFLVEYFLILLIYLIIYYTGVPNLDTRPHPLRPNSNLVWNTTICFIITIAASTSLALYCLCIIDRTTCLLILFPATLTRTLRPIWVTLERIWLKLKWSTQKRNEMFAVSSVTGSNAALSA